MPIIDPRLGRDYVLRDQYERARSKERVSYAKNTLRERYPVDTMRRVLDKDYSALSEHKFRASTLLQAAEQKKKTDKEMLLELGEAAFSGAKTLDLLLPGSPGTAAKKEVQKIPVVGGFTAGVLDDLTSPVSLATIAFGGPLAAGARRAVPGLAGRALGGFMEPLGGPGASLARKTTGELALTAGAHAGSLAAGAGAKALGAPEPVQMGANIVGGLLGGGAVSYKFPTKRPPGSVDDIIKFALKQLDFSKMERDYIFFLRGEGTKLGLDSSKINSSILRYKTKLKDEGTWKSTVEEFYIDQKFRSNLDFHMKNFEDRYLSDFAAQNNFPIEEARAKFAEYRDQNPVEYELNVREAWAAGEIPEAPGVIEKARGILRGNTRRLGVIEEDPVVMDVLGWKKPEPNVDPLTGRKISSVEQTAMRRRDWYAHLDDRELDDAILNASPDDPNRRSMMDERAYRKAHSSDEKMQYTRNVIRDGFATLKDNDLLRLRTELRDEISKRLEEATTPQLLERAQVRNLETYKELNAIEVAIRERGLEDLPGLAGREFHPKTPPTRSTPPSGGMMGFAEETPRFSDDYRQARVRPEKGDNYEPPHTEAEMHQRLDEINEHYTSRQPFLAIEHNIANLDDWIERYSYRDYGNPEFVETLIRQRQIEAQKFEKLKAQEPELFENFIGKTGLTEDELQETYRRLADVRERLDYLLYNPRSSKDPIEISNLKNEEYGLKVRILNYGRDNPTQEFPAKGLSHQEESYVQMSPVARRLEPGAVYDRSGVERFNATEITSQENFIDASRKLQTIRNAIVDLKEELVQGKNNFVILNTYLQVESELYRAIKKWETNQLRPDSPSSGPRMGITGEQPPRPNFDEVPDNLKPPDLSSLSDEQLQEMRQKIYKSGVSPSPILAEWRKAINAEFKKRKLEVDFATETGLVDEEKTPSEEVRDWLRMNRARQAERAKLKADKLNQKSGKKGPQFHGLMNGMVEVDSFETPLRQSATIELSNKIGRVSEAINKTTDKFNKPLRKDITSKSLQHLNVALKRVWASADASLIGIQILPTVPIRALRGDWRNLGTDFKVMAQSFYRPEVVEARFHNMKVQAAEEGMPSPEELVTKYNLHMAGAEGVGLDVPVSRPEAAIAGARIDDPAGLSRELMDAISRDARAFRSARSDSFIPELDLRLDDIAEASDEVLLELRRMIRESGMGQLPSVAAWRDAIEQAIDQRGIKSAEETIDLLGKIANAPLIKQSNRMFAMGGDVHRLGTAYSILRWHRNVMGRELTDDLIFQATNSANRATGWSPRAFGGAVGDVALFAPRFFQSQIEMVTKAATDWSPRSIEGGEARQQLAFLLGTAAFLTWAANEARGHETEWNPSDPNFLRVRDVKGADISLLGPWDSLIKGVIRTAQGDKDYVLRSKASPLLSISWDLISETNFMGQSTHNLENILRSMLPFSVREAKIGIGDTQVGEQGQPLASTITGIFGFKGTPLTEEEKLNIKLERAGISEDDPDYQILRRQWLYDNPEERKKSISKDSKYVESVRKIIEPKQEKNEQATLGNKQKLVDFRNNRLKIIMERRLRLAAVLKDTDTRKPKTIQDEWIQSYFKIYDEPELLDFMDDVIPEKFDVAVEKWEAKYGPEARDYMDRYLLVGKGEVETQYLKDIKTLKNAGVFDIPKYINMKSGLSEYEIDQLKDRVSVYRRATSPNETFEQSTKKILDGMSKEVISDVINAGRRGYTNPEYDKIRDKFNKELMWFHPDAFWLDYQEAGPRVRHSSSAQTFTPGKSRTRVLYASPSVSKARSNVASTRTVAPKLSEALGIR